MATKIWLVGQNISGYLPDTPLFVTDSWEDARSYQVCEIIGNDGLHDMYLETLRVADGDDTDLILESLANIEQCLWARDDLRKAKESREWGCTIGIYSLWITEVSRADLEIDDDIEGEELKLAIQEINESGF